MIQKTLIASAISLVMLSGCSDSNSPAGSDDGSNNNNNNGIVESSGDGDVNDNGSDNGNGSGGQSIVDAEAAERALQQLQNSDAFYAALREGLIRQNQIEGGAGTSGEVATDLLVDSANVGDTAGTTAGDTAGANETLASPAVAQSQTDGADAPVSVTNQAGAGDTSDVTGTNVQEVGVDEQDRMKSDGEFLYILENQYGDEFPIGVAGLDEVPPVDGVTTTVSEPMEPASQGVGNGDSDDQVVDFTIELLPVTPVDNSIPVEPLSPEQWPQPNNTTKIRILALQHDVPDAVPLTDLQLDLGGGTADGMYLFKDNAQRSVILTSTSFNEYLYAWDYPYAFINASSLVSKLDVTNPDQANVEHSVKIDGQIISSRRINDKLFVASRYYPYIPNIDPYSMSPEEYESAIAAADLTQALPQITSADGTTTDLVRPAECFVAARGQSEDYYYTPDIVSLAVIDLKTLELQDSECFLGSSEALYATPNSVYLATTRWDYNDFPILENQTIVDDSEFVFEDPRIDTDIHQFAINGAELTYSGSGVVSGHLGWNPTRKPFRMSEKGDYLRVATFSETQNESVSPIKLSVLNVAGDGELVKISELPNANNPEHIGKPGEQLYASRFIGDRAYLVTFRQTDPLYVVDISDPAAPKLAGELEIEGYSDYLQPIGENHLLGIGRDAVPGPVEWGEGALEQGVKLSLFNIADASNPTEVQSVVIGERGTQAAALRNHRAITIQPATDSHPARVAFGIDVHGLADPRPPADNPTVWYPWNFSGLHGFDINVGSGAGIEARGAMIVNSASNPRPSTFGNGGDDRSVIVGNAVYYIRSSEVFAAYWSDLGNFNGPR